MSLTHLPESRFCVVDRKIELTCVVTSYTSWGWTQMKEVEKGEEEEEEEKNSSEEKTTGRRKLRRRRGPEE